jgi:hypothetical protein
LAVATVPWRGLSGTCRGFQPRLVATCRSVHATVRRAARIEENWQDQREQRRAFAVVDARGASPEVVEHLLRSPDGQAVLRGALAEFPRSRAADEVAVKARCQFSWIGQEQEKPVACQRRHFKALEIDPSQPRAG